MRISFDLDDTLICYQDGVPCEPPLHFLLRLFVHDEPLRFGTRTLIQDLRERGWEVWLYTTSYRPPASIRRWLWFHGIRVDGVINQEMHEQMVSAPAHERLPSKNPGVFGINLHVDESEGVRIEGERHGFKVVVISPEDEAWTEKVQEMVQEFEARKNENTIEI